MPAPVWGVSLRHPFVRPLLAQESAKVAHVEILIDNYSWDRSTLRMLEQLRGLYDLSFHCIGLSLASPDGVDGAYIKDLARWVECLQPKYVSDHLSWSAYRSHYFADLLPLAYNEVSLDICAANVLRAQEELGRTLAVENTTAYIDFADSAFSEGEFLSRLSTWTGCQLLLDVQNVYANALNRKRAPAEEIARYPLEKTAYGHVAGGRWIDGVYVDTHSTSPAPELGPLLGRVLDQLPECPIVLEWDQSLPPFATIDPLLTQLEGACARHAA